MVSRRRILKSLRGNEKFIRGDIFPCGERHAVVKESKDLFGGDQEGVRNESFRV